MWFGSDLNRAESTRSPQAGGGGTPRMSKSLIPAQRRQKILEYLQFHQVASISGLAEMLGASEATIRRDLEWLEAEGIAERTHRRAVLTPRKPPHTPHAPRPPAPPQVK